MLTTVNSKDFSQDYRLIWCFAAHRFNVPSARSHPPRTSFDDTNNLLMPLAARPQRLLVERMAIEKAEEGRAKDMIARIRRASRAQVIRAARSKAMEARHRAREATSPAQAKSAVESKAREEDSAERRCVRFATSMSRSRFQRRLSFVCTNLAQVLA